MLCSLFLLTSYTRLKKERKGRIERIELEEVGIEEREGGEGEIEVAGIGGRRKGIELARIGVEGRGEEGEE